MDKTPVDERSLICLFAKAPVPGQVKTRMQPLLDASRSAALHRDLVRHAVRRLSALPDAHFAVELYITAVHPFFDQLSRDSGLALQLQRGDDLGQRMAHAVEQGLRRFREVVLVGADWPFINADLLMLAQESLAQVPAVVVPARDGGYVLLGLTQCDSRLFEGVTWGGGDVVAQTEARLRELAWPCRRLACSADIDTPEDLALLAEVPELAHWTGMSKK